MKTGPSGSILTPSPLTRGTAPVETRPILNAFPAPVGQPVNAGLWIRTVQFSLPSRLDAQSLRIDHALSDKVTLFGRYNRAPSYTESGFAQVEHFRLSSTSLTLGLTAWAASGETLAPAGGALISAALTIAWALATPLATIVVFGCLSFGYGLCAWRSRLPEARFAACCLAVVAAAAFAESAAFTAGLSGWQAGLAALGVGACGQLIAGLIARRNARSVPGRAHRREQSHMADAEAGQNGLALRADVAIEISGWLVTAFGAGQCLGRPGTASAATAVAGITSLGVAARADRRPAFWTGVVLCYVAWCIGLAANGVSTPEPYTGPAALAAIAAGWKASGQEPRPHSWLAYGPGLGLGLLPSLVMAWDGAGWVRPAAVGVASVGIAIIGARTRKQAPLLVGVAVAVLEAARGLAPDVAGLVHALPGWVPAAVGGAVLLWAGATYEARLRNLRAIRHTLASMN